MPRGLLGFPRLTNLGPLVKGQKTSLTELIKEYRYLYQSIDKNKSESIIANKQRRMKEIRKILVEEYGWSWKYVGNLGDMIEEGKRTSEIIDEAP